MADQLRIRLYNILLGDAILVSVPDEDEKGKKKLRHILIDVGNKPGGDGANKSLFEPIFENILKELDGEPLDLYVMTHEHMDHVQGPLYESRKFDAKIGDKLAPRFAWLTGSAAPTYYDEHPEAKKKKELALATYVEAKRLFATDDAPPQMLTLLGLNDPRATDDCVEYLRGFAKKTHYIHRGVSLKGKHPFRKATFSIWAPEEDTSIYYGRMRKLMLGDGDADGATHETNAHLVPPSGVDAGAFYDLVNSRASGAGANLFAIDKAANNTSIVFCLEWRGKKLLFCGDAEERSWAEMDAQDVLEPVDFLKIGHHGSHNGTPGVDILDKVLPKGGKRQAAISTCTGAYSGMPDKHTLDEIGKRAKIFSTEKDSNPGEWVDVFVSA